MNQRKPARDFAGIYEEHVWRVYGFLAYRLSSRQDAEDLTQQTFERALKAWSRYDPARASVLTWLLVIARNLLVDHLRAGGSTAAHQPLEEEQWETISAPPDQPSLGIDPLLETALTQLGPRERELIALRFGGDLTGQEIADMTGLTLANVQQILSRSLRRMRGFLDGEPAAAGLRSGTG
jgi:RNA polymerase sigma-70 factor (ECF subfamily)